MSWITDNTASDQFRYNDLMDQMCEAITSKPRPAYKSPSDFSEAELVLELISRGYAVSRLPVDEHAEEASA